MVGLEVHHSSAPHQHAASALEPVPCHDPPGAKMPACSGDIITFQWRGSSDQTLRSKHLSSSNTRYKSLSTIIAAMGNCFNSERDEKVAYFVHARLSVCVKPSTYKIYESTACSYPSLLHGDSTLFTLGAHCSYKSVTTTFIFFTLELPSDYRPNGLPSPQAQL
jgi:hypothetical protein